MRRDTQIGIILGIVILVIIGVFLSTRTSDTEAILPDLAMSEEGKQKSSVDEIDINEFIKESRKTEPVKTISTEITADKVQTNEEPVKLIQQENILVETDKDDTSLEGKWEGTVGEVAEEIVDESEITEESTDSDKVEVAEKIQPEKEVVEEVVVVQKKKPEATTSYTVPEKKIYKVESNDNLFKIARKHYGDGRKWNKIFEANKDSLPNPDALHVGQELIIPDLSVDKSKIVKSTAKSKLKKEGFVSANTHTVQSGDTLYRIAEKYYGDPAVWHEIFEANEETIEDKGLLIEGQILILPKL